MPDSARERQMRSAHLPGRPPGLNSAMSKSPPSRRAPGQRGRAAVLGPVASKSAQGKFNTLFRENSVHPPNRFLVGKIVTNRGKVHEVKAADLAKGILVRVAVKDGLHLRIRLRNAEQR